MITGRPTHLQTYWHILIINEN